MKKDYIDNSDNIDGDNIDYEELSDKTGQNQDFYCKIYRILKIDRF
jgi:hypothetical protein